MGAAAWDSARLEQRLATLLALLAGYVDAYGFLSYRTYLSFMSGNTTQTGSAIGRGDLALALPAGIAILGFVIGVFSGALLASSALRQALRLTFAAVTALLAAVLVLTQIGILTNSLAAIAALSLAMGIMNSVLTHVGAQSLNIGFVTGTVTTMARHVALAVRRIPLPDAQGPWDTQLSRARLLFGVWAAFISGALLAGIATSRFGVWMLLPPLVVLLGLTMARLSRL